MMSFRKKILLSYLVVLLLFIGIMYPIASQTVQNIVYSVMSDRAEELIDKIYEAPNDEALVQRLKDQKYLIFFRVSVITDERKVLYDNYTKRMLGPRFNKDLVTRHPEVEEAFEYGMGYHEGYSKLLDQKFSYMAMSFDFHGKTYVLRTAFPYKFVSDMTNDFEMGFIGLSLAVLALFSLMVWFVIQHLTKPIHQIITAVKPFQEGKVKTLPEIKIDISPEDDFGKLANTLNELSSKIQSQIDTLMLERNEKEAVLESLVEGVVAVNEKMIVTYANHTALKLLETEASQLIGQHFSVAKQHRCYALLEKCQEEINVQTDTLQMSSKEGKVYLDIVAAPQKNNSGAVLVMEDKSTHYKLLEMRKDFIANASHELKTPITIIRGFAETLHDHPDLPRDTAVSITGKIVQNTKRMGSLIKDLLTLTDIENIPQSRLIDCDFYSLIQSCVITVQEVHTDAVIDIQNETGKDLHIFADPSLIELAITNLLENAAKYSQPPAQITVNISREGKMLKILIADKGIGIPKNDLEHIFERFYTVNKAHSRKMGGSGLGLSIVKTIVEKHFGKISVNSELGKGTVFTILLPISENI